MSTFAGIRIYQSEVVGEPYEDWSHVRSPSRARRRLKQGHPQRIVKRYKANDSVMMVEAQRAAYVHPHDYPELMKRLSEAGPK